ncbi:putative metal-dependent hydrolase [Mangrovimonas sp. CR14]|uniref:YfiT family bacillithiol transferase n=1 Tax=Mangrovimonas sp. CR14 TaxID=2706120 RepID=UPI00142049AF|nr:putative metal-dependent hydrolase [Mangrovimonas sp. CR14]NIK92578.1 putative metal-dependent hydrolase [Mangrovimonas sp. CR14]
MTEAQLEKLKYPIGNFELPSTITPGHIEEWIDVLETFPKRLTLLVHPLTDEQLETPYRPYGWTVRQLIHHIADSHHHSYARFKWALTENKPVIKAYYEDRWADLFDSKTAPIQLSLDHLTAVHGKLVYLLKGLSPEDFEKSFIHPETHSEIPLKVNLGMYSWHSLHHYAHIEHLIIRNHWH